MKHSNSIDPQHVQQDFDEFLVEEGIATEVEGRVIKKLVLALLSDTAPRKSVAMFEDSENGTDTTDPKA